jgi:hypothetical protein
MMIETPYGKKRWSFLKRVMDCHSDLAKAVEMVLDAGTDDGEEKSASEVVDLIDWDMLREAHEKDKGGN